MKTGYSEYHRREVCGNCGWVNMPRDWGAFPSWLGTAVDNDLCPQCGKEGAILNRIGRLIYTDSKTLFGFTARDWTSFEIKKHE